MLAAVERTYVPRIRGTSLSVRALGATDDLPRERALLAKSHRSVGYKERKHYFSKRG